MFKQVRLIQPATGEIHQFTFYGLIHETPMHMIGKVQRHLKKFETTGAIEFEIEFDDGSVAKVSWKEVKDYLKEGAR